MVATVGGGWSKAWAAPSQVDSEVEGRCGTRSSTVARRGVGKALYSTTSGLRVPTRNEYFDHGQDKLFVGNLSRWRHALVLQDSAGVVDELEAGNRPPLCCVVDISRRLVQLPKYTEEDLLINKAFPFNIARVEDVLGVLEKLLVDQAGIHTRNKYGKADNIRLFLVKDLCQGPDDIVGEVLAEQLDELQVFTACEAPALGFPLTRQA